VSAQLSSPANTPNTKIIKSSIDLQQNEQAETPMHFQVKIDIALTDKKIIAPCRNPGGELCSIFSFQLAWLVMLMAC